MRWYEWNPEKAASNLRKHCVSFEDAVKAFDDPNGLSQLLGIEGGEQRWRIVGSIYGMVVIVVIHTLDDEGEDEIVRIISARRADRTERLKYETALRSHHRF
jgi:hypothetical protein